MNKKNLEILGLSEGATAAEIRGAYDTLRAKYLEERFMDGEVGNNAARMLNSIETAYNDLMNELKEGEKDGSTGFARVEELIDAGNIADAQRELDSFNERGAQWHFLQSKIFYRKNWINESKKQLEIAIQLDSENEKYKETYRKLNDKIASENVGGAAGPQGVYQGQTMNSPADDSQMGGGTCANCLECCYTYMCINCLCNACCH